MRYIVKDVKTGANVDVNLTDRDFITEGGEGKIYGKAGTIYKIYHDQRKMIPTSKMKELQALTLANILKPTDTVVNNHVPVGFTMRWEKDTVALCKLFTTDFWRRFNLNINIIQDLLENMVDGIKFIHSKGFLMVDGNEMNYLVDSNSYKIPYFIDVDSWQTPSFPATAIMPSIRDYHSKDFSELTDWFAFGIIAVQLFIGIHPYKGTHPAYRKSELEKRMRDNVSIFGKDISLPASVRDMSNIPPTYKDWFINIFEKGMRDLPPTVKSIVVVVAKPQVVKTTNRFIMDLIGTYNGYIIRVDDYGNVFTSDKIYIGKAEYDANPGSEIIYTRQTSTPIKVDIIQGRLYLSTMSGEPLVTAINCTDKTIINGMLFVKNNDKLMEIAVEEFNGRMVTVVKSTWNVMLNSTKVMNGIVIQDVLGVPYFVIPYTLKTGKTACMIKPVQELVGYKILEAKHDGNVVMVVVYKKDKYERIIFKISDDYSTIHEYMKCEVTYHTPNFVTLDNGIVVSINDEDMVEVFSRRIDRTDMNIVADPAIDFDMKLCKQGVSVYIRKDNKLFKFVMKK